jgi:hypothetical protein
MRIMVGLWYGSCWDCGEDSGGTEVRHKDHIGLK